MSWLALLGWGLGFGVVSAAPVGPVGVLIVRATLDAGPRAGIATLAGLLTGEAIYVIVFALGGGTLLANESIRDPLAIVAALFLAFLGVRAIRAASAPPPDSAQGPSPSVSASYRVALAITVTNPAIALLFGGLLAGAASSFGAALVERHLVLLLVAMELGVALWFGALIALTGWLRRRSAMRGVRGYVDRIAGIALLACAAHLALGVVL